MSQQRSRKRNDDYQWERYKTAIKHLYIAENKPLEGPDGVVERMIILTKNEFNKTPRQYETRLRKWGIRKNQRGEHWEIIGRKIAARKGEGKESVVYFEGNELPQAKIDKRIYCNNYDITFERHNQGPVPATPKGFTILTPIAKDQEPFPTYNLPFVEFQLALRGGRPQILESTRNHFELQDVHATLPSVYSSSLAMEPQTLQEIEVHRRAADTYYKIILPKMNSLLPTVAVEGCAESGSETLPSLEVLHHSHLNLLYFSVANNFAGLPDFSPNLIWDFVRTQASVGELIQMAPGPTTKALVEKLFTCAIERGDLAAVEYLLQEGCVDANEHVCIIDDIRYTPVKLAASYRDIRTTKLLVHYKADVNKTCENHNESYGYYYCHGALQHAIQPRYSEKDTRLDPELVSVLLDAGARTDLRVLESTIRKGEGQVAEILFRHGICGNQDLWTESGAFHGVFKCLDIGTAKKIFQLMLEAKANINHLIDWKKIRHLFVWNPESDIVEGEQTLLDIAARRGSIHLVQTVLGSGALLTEETLTCAIQSANEDLISYLLHKGAKVNSLTASGRTPYAEAIRNGYHDLIHVLEDNGALDGIEDGPRFESAICAASQVGHIDLLKYLVETVGDLRHEMRDELGWALAHAVQAGHEEVALFLIDVDANVNLGPLCYHRPQVYDKNPPGSPLHEALTKKMGNLVRVLLNICAHPGYWDPATALQTAVNWGDSSIIRDLIFAGASVNEAHLSGNPPLTMAVEKNDMELVRLLLAEGADINNPFARDMSALAAAVGNGSIDMTRFLLEQGADPADAEALLRATSQSPAFVSLLLEAHAKRYPCGKRGYGSRALVKAIEEDNLIMLEVLLRSNIDFGTLCEVEVDLYKAPLACAIECNDSATLQRLIDRKIDLDDIVCAEGTSYSGSIPQQRLTALLVAARSGDPKILQMLIDAGANVNLPATRGVSRTPLQMAAEFGNMAASQILIKNGAELNADPAVSGGGTALQLAAIGGFIGIAEELLRRGANVNASPAKRHGRTALEGAVEHGRLDMVRFLINAGAEMKSPGYPQYDKLLQLAKKNGHRVVLEMLQSFSPDAPSLTTHQLHPNSKQNFKAQGGLCASTPGANGG